MVKARTIGYRTCFSSSSTASNTRAIRPCFEGECGELDGVEVTDEDVDFGGEPLNLPVLAKWDISITQLEEEGSGDFSTPVL